MTFSGAVFQLSQPQTKLKKLKLGVLTKPDPNPNESLSFAIKESKVNESS